MQLSLRPPLAARPACTRRHLGLHARPARYPTNAPRAEVGGEKTLKRSPLIERLGGREAVNEAVTRFYEKVLADERVSGYFANTDMKKQRAHQAAFMSYAFGGANQYSGKNMAEAHRSLVPHLQEVHFNAIVEHLEATLQELGVARDDIDEALAVVASTKPDVLAE